jgi:hypothetical protein
MQIQLGEIESVGGYKLQDLRIYNSDGLLMTTIAVRLFDQVSGRIGPVLELTLTPRNVSLNPLIVRILCLYP